VTRSPLRIATATVAVSLAALALTGCGNSPVRSGAAATVGSARISTDQLAGLVTRGLKDPQAQQQLGADKAKFQRQTLARLIRHQLLLKAAGSAGVTASPGAIDAKLADFERQAGGSQQLLQQAAQGGIAAQDLRPFVADLVLIDALGDKLTQGIDVPAAALQGLYAKNIAQYDQVHAAHILVAKKALADAILSHVKADPAQFAALAAKNSTDTSNKDKGGDLGFAGRGSFVKEFENAVFSARPGAFLEVKTQFGFHVVHVLERRTTTLEQATPELRRNALQQQRDQRVGQLLSSLARSLHVKVNPRFGRWDDKQLQVVAASTPDTVSSPAPSAGGGTPGPGAVVPPPSQ
jgi:foldase protein PrsA